MSSSGVAYRTNKRGIEDRISVKTKLSSSFMQHHVVILHYTKSLLSQMLYFPKIYNHALLFGSTASGASVDPTSEDLVVRHIGITHCRKEKSAVLG
jgi:hypothetical protein